MIIIDNYIAQFTTSFSKQQHYLPWEITAQLTGILTEMIGQLDISYHINEGVAIHQSATVEEGSVLKAPAIIGPNCFISANAYLRGGVFLQGQVIIGTGCEIKTSLVFSGSTIAHFNFIGDSIIGSHVNFEGGAITANHFNEREEKRISVVCNSSIIDTGVTKFGALVGDHSKIGANAVLSPGTILTPISIVGRLELIEQLSTLSARHHR